MLLSFKLAFPTSQSNRKSVDHFANSCKTTYFGIIANNYRSQSESLSQFQLLDGTVFTDKSIASLRALIS